MRGRARGRQAAESTVTIDVQAQAIGTVSANTLAGWTHVQLTVSSFTGFGGTYKYIGSDADGGLKLQSKAISRDQEVTFFVILGRAYLRVTNNRALRFDININAGGGWTVSYVQIGTGSSESDTVIAAIGSGTLSGFNNSDTDGDTITFGVDGVEVYVKYNGSEQWRDKQLFAIKPGCVGFRTGSLRTVSATFKQSTAIFSSLDQSIIDVRDFGVKDLATTGSMSAASTTLTVASNPGFAIGDPIIVEIGGEAGAGARGTRGVGGQWPTLTYANATARDADTSQATGVICALLDTGITYEWTGSAWSRWATTGFTDVMLPKALLATITNISGTTFTLDTASTVATTNANVYLNAAAKYAEVIGQAYTGGEGELADYTIRFPTGDFAWGVMNDLVRLGINRIRWSLVGDGMANTRIFSPNGTTSLELKFTSNTGPFVVRDLWLDSNCRADGGYIELWDDGTERPNQNQTANLLLETCSNFEVYNVKTSDHGKQGIALSYCTDASVYDCELYHATGHRAYTQWALNFANCTDCAADSVLIDCDFFLAGFEQFQCTGCEFTNITGRNTFCAVNSSDNWRYANIVITLETGAADETYQAWHSSSSPVVNINSNIDNQQGNGDGAANGLFEDFTITQQADFRSGVVFGMIGLSGTVNFITIRGQYPAKPNSLGLLDFPNYSDSNCKGIGVENSNATRTMTIEGVRVKGVNFGGNDIAVPSTNATVTNSVANTVSVGGATSNNITNAEYEALP